jgi:hypothetical protein
MNKLSKLSLTRLSGSLATLTAVEAGDLSVSGSMTMTMTKKSGATTGNPLGMASALSFKGSGELDGGQAVDLVIDNTDQNAYSSSSVKLTTNSLGTFKLTQGTGGAGIGGYDDNMPRAFEEAWDTGIGSGVDLAKGVGSSMTVSWTTPAVLGTTLQVAYAPRNDGATPNDKATGGSTNALKQSAYDIVLDSSQDFGMAAASVFVGYSLTEQDPGIASGGDKVKDREEGVVGATLTVGPVKAGWQRTGEYTGLNQGDSNVFGYKNTSWGVSFNVNDALSVSYAEFESIRGKVAHSNSGAGRPTTTVESIQAAYTMGGATFRIAEVNVDNNAYSNAASADLDATIISLGLAF